MQLSSRTKFIPPSGTSRMRTIGSELKKSGLDIINMASGELDISVNTAIKNAAKKAIDNGCNKYTPTLGLRELREGIALHVSSRCGIDYAASEVGITAGAKQALFNVAMVLFDPGDEVIIPLPYWVTFPIQVQIAGARPVFLDTRKSGYRFDVASIDNLITSATKAIIINTPNNPTGVVYNSNDILRIAQLAIDRNIWVIFDECYSEFLRPSYVHCNIVQMLKSVKDRAILINSFSKSLALAGWRIGYVCGPDRVIEAIANVQGHMTSNPCSISQYAVEAALQNGYGDLTAAINHDLSERLRHVLPIVDAMKDISCAPPEGAFYLFLNIERKLRKRFGSHFISDVEVLCELLLKEARVTVVPGHAFGDPTGIRLTYALGTEEVVEGLRRLAEFFDRID